MPLRSLIACSIVLLALPLAAQQQQDSAPPPQNPPAQTNPQKKDQQKKPSTADQNPFPEAQSEAAAHQSSPQDNSTSQPDAPQPQASPESTSQNKTGSQNPFPQTQSEKAAHQAQPQNLPAAAAPNSSNDQNYSSSHVKGLDMPDTSETPPPDLPPTSLPYSPKLARKDSQIGDYYLESGNYRGAYERFLEANHSDPGNAEAVYGLAESARHLGHTDEALRNYRLYLSALPTGPHAKEVRKALKEMGAAPAS